MPNRADVLNRWANDPAVRLLVSPGLEFYDFSGLVHDPDTLLFEHPKGCSLFIPMPEGGYDGHFLFGPELRGREALHVSQRMINSVFTTYKAEHISGTIFRGNLPARVMARALGFSSTGRAPVDFFGRPCVGYALYRWNWALQPYSRDGVCDTGGQTWAHLSAEFSTPSDRTAPTAN